MNSLVVMDPALGRGSGRHLAFAELLAAWDGTEPVGVCGSVAMDTPLRQRLAQRCDLVEGIFDLDIHALDGVAGGASEHWDWIYELAKGYMSAFERVLARWPGRPVRILHPALSWEHANALALAIKSLDHCSGYLQHVALLMHSPGVDGAGRTIDGQRRLNFQIAFDVLRNVGCVDLYANDGSLAEAYRHLLQRPAALPLHPGIAQDHEVAVTSGEQGAPQVGHADGQKASLRERSRSLRNWLATLPERPAVSVKSGTDVVLFWKQNDSTLYGRRNDMVAHYLASRGDVRRVLVIDAPIDDERLAFMTARDDPLRHDGLIAERVRKKAAGLLDEGKLAYSVFVHPRGSFGHDEQNRPSQAFLDAYETFLRETFARHGIEPARAVFWVYPRNFSLPPLLPRLSPGKVVVDVVDDHRAWSGIDEAEKARLTENYRELLACADLALANCEPVRAGMAELGHEPKLVPNGTDAPLPVHIADVSDADGPLREHLAFTGRILGFVGNLEPKIDIALLARLAETFPHCRLVLVGSTHANPAVKALLRHPNVRMPGVVPYDKLGAWLSRFDVGLIPHRRIELTRYMNPLKAYVYLANGVPVVATEVANVEPVPGLLAVARDSDAFLAAVSDCLANGRPSHERFEAFSRAHGWASRLGPHLDAMGFGIAASAHGPSHHDP